MIILLGANKESMEEAIANAKALGHRIRVQNTLTSNTDETNVEEAEVALSEIKIHE